MAYSGLSVFYYTLKNKASSGANTMKRLCFAKRNSGHYYIPPLFYMLLFLFLYRKDQFDLIWFNSRKVLTVFLPEKS